MVRVGTFAQVLKVNKRRGQTNSLIVLLQLDVSDRAVDEAIFEDQKGTLICPTENSEVFLHPHRRVCHCGLAMRMLLARVALQLQDQLATAVRVGKHVEVLLLEAMPDCLFAQRVSLTHELGFSDSALLRFRAPLLSLIQRVVPAILLLTIRSFVRAQPWGLLVLVVHVTAFTRPFALWLFPE